MLFMILLHPVALLNGGVVDMTLACSRGVVVRTVLMQMVKGHLRPFEVHGVIPHGLIVA